MEEIWDLYDKTGQRLNKTVARSRQRDIADGEFMLAVHIFIVNSRGEWLIQRRSDVKDWQPGTWDITGGAVLSGEESRDAAIREVREELGVTLLPGQLQLCRRLIRSRSLVDLWLAKADFALSDCVLQPEEVSAVRWVGTPEFIALLRNADYREAADEYAAVGESVVREARADFRCPVCGEALLRDERTLHCVRRHSYDLARQGYVNLLRSQTSSAGHHGDDKLMVASRSAFLDAGHYAHLREAVVQAALERLPAFCTVLDAGCGEGYYTAELYRAASEAGKDPAVLGVDVSKDALIAAARRCKALRLAVGSIFALPVSDASCDLIVNIFAPSAPSEFVRVLRPGGFLLRVFPLRRHLFELKAAVYDHPYENEEPSPELPGLTLTEVRRLCRPVHLENGGDIHRLFAMTPYYYKTGAADQSKLDALNELTVTTEFGLALYQKSEAGHE